MNPESFKPNKAEEATPEKIEGTKQETKEISKELFEEYLSTVKSHDDLFEQIEDARGAYFDYKYGEADPAPSEIRRREEDWNSWQSMQYELFKKIDRMRQENPDVIYIEKYLYTGRKFVFTFKKLHKLSNEQEELLKKGSDRRETEQFKNLSQRIEEENSELKNLSSELNIIRTGLPDYVVERMEKEVQGITMTKEEFDEYMIAVDANDLSKVNELRAKNRDLIKTEKYSALLRKHNRLCKEYNNARGTFYSNEKTFGRGHPETKEAIKIADEVEGKIYFITTRLTSLQSQLPDFVIKELEERDYANEKAKSEQS